MSEWRGAWSAQQRLSQLADGFGSRDQSAIARRATEEALRRCGDG